MKTRLDTMPAMRRCSIVFIEKVVSVISAPRYPKISVHCMQGTPCVSHAPLSVSYGEHSHRSTKGARQTPPSASAASSFRRSPMSHDTLGTSFHDKYDRPIMHLVPHPERASLHNEVHARPPEAMA